MCGICGVIQIGGPARETLPLTELARMTDVMTHRGPNDRGLLHEPGVALGVRRLSIVDVEGGHQPIANEDETIWAIQNGELYNHRDIRASLDGAHSFRTSCDTEIIPHLYEEHGAAFPEQLRGMFGIAVWDRPRRRAVVTRDRLGIKPIYHARAGDLLVFASELKSLLASGLVEAELDYEAIDAYLSLGLFPGPRTPLAGVAKLLPGESLVVDGEGVRTETYWSFPAPDPDDGLGRLDAASASVLELLEESVRLRLMSDVPLGAMLSGGLDSSLIVALMARNMSEPVQTFAVGFSDAGQLNELSDARRVAEAFGTDHHELELTPGDRAIDLEDLVWHLDEPLADLSSLGFFALSELASRHVTVALSGQGADELFAGYRKHRAIGSVGRWHAAARAAARPVGRAAARYGPRSSRRAGRLLAAGDAADRLLASTGLLTPRRRQSLFRGELARLDGGAARRALVAKLDGVRDDPLPAALYLDGQVGLVDDMLHYFDRVSMAHSLEVRVPFLDHKLVELCARIPSRLKLNGQTSKYVLKHAARGILPDGVIDKPKIGFFNSAVTGWLRGEANDATTEILLQPNPRYAELLDQDDVRRLVRRNEAGRADKWEGQLLLSILMLELWLSSYLPRATRRPELEAAHAVAR
jgi:asparagine synthase (glutamine-hydrolysing)